MMGDLSAFRSYTPYENPESITLADGAQISCAGEGTVDGITKYGKVSFTKVLYVLSLKGLKNLLSVSKLTEKGVCIVFENETVKGSIKNETIFEGTRFGGLYRMKLDSEKQANLAKSADESRTETANKWHRIMGHLNYSDVLNLREKAVPGEIIHVDLGFIDGEPFICFTDEVFNCTYTEILKRKNDATEALKRFHRNVKNQYEMKIKELHCDGGGEFLGSFKEYADLHGIKVIPTTADTPEQNAKSERKNRTIKETTSSLLADAQLDPRIYGADAILHATFLRNRCPRNEKMTCIEAFTGKRPNLRFFRSQMYFNSSQAS
jgi:hypothetical protein